MRSATGCSCTGCCNVAAAEHAEGCGLLQLLLHVLLWHLPLLHLLLWHLLLRLTSARLSP